MTQGENIGYYSGYRKPLISKRRGLYLLIPKEKPPVLVLPFGEKGNCEEMSWLYPDHAKFWAGHSGSPGQPELSASPVSLLTELVRGLKPKKVGIESDELVQTMRLEMTLADYDALRESLPDVKFAPAAHLIWESRMVKSQLEAEYVKTSCKITCKGYEAALSSLRVGITEKELAKKFYQTIIDEGGQDDPLSAFLHLHSGKERAHVRNARPTERKLQEGDFVGLDGGACYRGYFTDIIRMGHVGKMSPREEEVFDSALRAQEASLKAIRAEAKMGTVYDAAHEAFVRAGHEPSKMVLASIGHGVGLDVHEPPLISRKNENRLRAGMVIAIEPGISELGINYAVENNVLVTESGYENLSPLREQMWIG